MCIQGAYVYEYKMITYSIYMCEILFLKGPLVNIRAFSSTLVERKVEGNGSASGITATSLLYVISYILSFTSAHTR